MDRTTTESSAEIVKFREMLEQRIEAKTAALDVVPEEHRPVIVKFIHERCVPTSSALYRANQQKGGYSL